MKKIGVLGHFALGTQKSDGQTIKTRIVGEALRHSYGDTNVDFIDTVGGWHFLLRLPTVLLSILFKYQNIIMLPAHNGVRIIVPLIVLANVCFHRRLHYIVIGGWLPSFASKNSLLKWSLKKLYAIYPETESMKEALERLQIRNAIVMPNTKPLNIVSEDEIEFIATPPFKLCTFSRVSKEKGIEEAIKAVSECNRVKGKTIYTLDIYGQIDHGQETWFNQLMQQQPNCIKYLGLIPYNKSTYVLKNYFALLFPTYYEGECFAGTLIDAMASGLPTIASDWHDNPNIVVHQEIGIIFPVHSVDELTRILLESAETPELINKMRRNCIKMAGKYKPEEVIKTLTSHIL